MGKWVDMLGTADHNNPCTHVDSQLRNLELHNQLLKAWHQLWRLLLPQALYRQSALFPVDWTSLDVWLYLSQDCTLPPWLFLQNIPRDHSFEFLWGEYTPLPECSCPLDTFIVHRPKHCQFGLHAKNGTCVALCYVKTKQRDKARFFTCPPCTPPGLLSLASPNKYKYCRLYCSS